MTVSLQSTIRTQDERSAVMRARLIQATLETILDCGYANTTLVAVASRAGVTRGAVHHHYASRDELIVDAISHQLREASAEIRQFARDAQDGHTSLEDFLELVWALFSGPFFMITLEHITASRHNDTLRQNLTLVTRDFHRALDETWNTFFTIKDRPKSELAIVLNATLCLFRGMGVQTVLRQDPAYYRSLIDFWRSVLVSHTHIAFHPASKDNEETCPRMV